MIGSYNMIVDITEDLGNGDVNLTSKRDSDQNYNMIPMGIMVSKNTATDDVETVVCGLRGGKESVTLYLKVNEIYPLGVEKVYNSGTTTEAIQILGIIN